MTERFLEAARGGDLEGLLATMAPDVVLLSDGGGIILLTSPQTTRLFTSLPFSRTPRATMR